MNLILIFTGLLFFLNPCVALVDILPDFIGAFLIVFALDKARFVMEKAESCFRLLFATAAASVIKTILSFFYSGFGDSTKLLWCAVFAVIDAVLLLMSFSSTSAVLDFAKMRYGSEETEGISGGDTSKLVKLISVYTVVRCFLSLIPELTALSGDSGGNLNKYLLSDFKSMFYILFTFIELVFLVFVLIWFIKSFRYFISDKTLSNNISVKFREIEQEKPLVIARSKLSLIYIIFIVAAVCSFSLYIDGKDILPKILSSVSFAVLLLCIPSKLKHKIPGFIACFILLAASWINIIITRTYFEDYTEENALWVPAAASLYRGITLSAIVEYLAVFALVLLSTELIKKYSVNVFSICSDTDYSERKIASVRKGTLVINIAGLIFCTVCSLVPVLRPYFGMISMIAFIVDIAFLASVYFADFSTK